jgi:hypothetical protein
VLAAPAAARRTVAVIGRDPQGADVGEHADPAQEIVPSGVRPAQSGDRWAARVGRST